MPLLLPPPPHRLALPIPHRPATTYFNIKAAMLPSFPSFHPPPPNIHNLDLPPPISIPPQACDYFNIKAVVVSVGSDYRLSAATVCRHITANTAIIVASAPGEGEGGRGGRLPAVGRHRAPPHHRQHRHHHCLGTG